MSYNTSEQFITNIIQLLKEQGNHKFLLNLDFKAVLYSDKEYEENPRNVNLLVDATNNYIGIWVCIQELWNEDKPFKSPYELSGEDFLFQSYHDSCWRSDGMRWIFDNYITMRGNLIKKVNKKLNIHEYNNAVTLRPSICFFRKVSFDTVKDKEFGYSVKNFKINN